ncbi:MAG: DUF1292 domain-containing protein [Lachnospiraceae bacterium]|nr:DUF1292 domain-containing protein [Lachnospiraceae bacterium]
MSDKLSFTISETGDSVDFYIIEETRVNNCNYILVTESDDENEDADAYILKDVSEPESEDALYEIVEDETELAAVSKIFGELLEDIDIE